jgi:hypothetical protein
MTPEELRNAAAVMLAAADGKLIEPKHKCGDWSFYPPCEPRTVIWDFTKYDYRVAITKPSINWDHVHPDFNYLCANSNNGCAQLHSEIPRKGDFGWIINNCQTKVIMAKGFASFKAGTCDWQDSLAIRPGVER